VVWAESPEGKGALPVVVAAVELSGEGEKLAQAEKAALQAVEFGFQQGWMAYNARHTDQIEVREEKDPRSGRPIKYLVNEKGFPPGFNPAFGIANGYLVVATSPQAVRTFEVPALGSRPTKDHATLARFSGVQTRDYILKHGGGLAKILSEFGAGAELTLLAQLQSIAAVLELVKEADVVLWGDENGLKVALRVTLAKPLKKP
jgi:hypothetical protein